MFHSLFFFNFSPDYPDFARYYSFFPLYFTSRRYFLIFHVPFLFIYTYVLSSDSHPPDQTNFLSNVERISASRTLGQLCLNSSGSSVFSQDNGETTVFSAESASNLNLRPRVIRARFNPKRRLDAENRCSKKRTQKVNRISLVAVSISSRNFLQ